MAYSNAVFYINLQSGSDAARAALTTCIASNPSGAITRINKTSHGLTTGAVVDLTLFSAWLNGAWKITVFDANNFDLDGAVWQATADNNGTVTPRGGSSWSDGWATISSGPTSARIQQGDTIRISKTPDPVSIGNATWTNLSKTVTLASAQTATIDNCESGWVAANSVTLAFDNSTRKQGTNSLRIQRTPWLASTLFAYKALGGTQNFSAYNAITFWYRTSAPSGNGSFRICLCSDAAGVTVVDTFTTPDTLGPSRWMPLTLTRDGGGNLGSAIQSIAIYTQTALPASGEFYYFDNFSACSSTGLNLTCLISKNSAAYGGSEPWHPVQSIGGTTVLIDNLASTDSASGKGYAGVSETATSYVRSTYATPRNTSNTAIINTPSSNGTVTSQITYTGGWNTATNLQDGETFLDGATSASVCFSLNQRSYNSFERLSAVRYYVGWLLYSTSGFAGGNKILSSSLVGNVFGGLLLNDVGSSMSLNSVNNNESGVSFRTISGVFTSTPLTVPHKINVQNLNNNTYGFLLEGGGGVTNDVNNQVLSASNAHNNDYAAYLSYANNNTLTLSSSTGNSVAAVFSNFGINYLRNSNFTGTEFAGAAGYADSRIFSTNHDGTLYGWIYTDGGTINSQATTFSPGSGAEWRLSVNSSARDKFYPLKFSAAQYAVNSGSTFQIRATMKKSHATDVTGRLVVPGGQLAGVENDVVSTLTNNTSQQTLLLSFTPEQTGVIDVQVWAEYVNGTGIVHIDEITCRS